MAGRILVANADRMCFKVDADTLEPCGASFYDPYVFNDPPPDLPIITTAEWNHRCREMQQAAQKSSNAA